MNITTLNAAGFSPAQRPAFADSQPFMFMMLQMMAVMSCLMESLNFGGCPACRRPFGGMSAPSPGLSNFLGSGSPNSFQAAGGFGSPAQANNSFPAPGPNTMSPPTGTAPLARLSDNRNERIQQIVDAAKRTHPNHPHLAKLAAAQALLESGIHTNRPSGLARNHNNLFGIKGRGTAGTAHLRTQEHLNGRNVTIRDGFARNATLEDSFLQHRNLLTRNRRYQSVVNASSFEEAALRIRQAGYATAPNYTSALLSVYRTHLARYF